MKKYKIMIAYYQKKVLPKDRRYFLYEEGFFCNKRFLIGYTNGLNKNESRHHFKAVLNNLKEN